ncbi:MAG: growth inhibitor PemK [Rhodospirillaceae bacterium]|nr:growth inhibitor PemK [Rhodospirillaceae bacterium]MBT4046062.1 growth inhibitor PemK [Rhodospirillaceae bacterium]MBT4688119.1 growth inhibitor PemK [Rhodospirillaceae bacterium]MBT5080286.1 growth inhibitor PemK [Rhodospirillaceae bacterium]MBT5525015.1 growth inhibitor PemK [Rhodospirillaceae bacterium]
MKRLEPENGLVIRYDFLWKNEADQGHDGSVKDRPCAVVLVTRRHVGGQRQVMVCPITHTLPHDLSSAIEISERVSRHLGLDDGRSWIRTHEVNTFVWEQGRLPYGITPAKRDNWFFGILPPSLHARMRDQVIALSGHKSLQVVRRDTGE